MKTIGLDYEHLLNHIDEKELLALEPKINACHTALYNQTGLGKEFLGWLKTSSLMSEKAICDIEETAQFVCQNVEYFLIIGIGGSYLGARAIISALEHSSYKTAIKSREKQIPHILFAGHHLDASYHQELLNLLQNKIFAINVISKSGSTLETAIAFRLFKNLLEKNLGIDKAQKLIFVTTDPKKGLLNRLALTCGYKQFPIPENIGGRYSVLTPVGLFPIACAGLNIQELLNGAMDYEKWTQNPKLLQNHAHLYAAFRFLLYQKGKKIEILVSYSEKLFYFTQWWQQLYGESLGKNLQGLFPSTSQFTTDLHSMGQWIQEGERTIFQTILNIQESDHVLSIPKDSQNLDDLNFLANQNFNLHDINQCALKATSLAHFHGNVPNTTIHIPKLNPYYLGQLIYFFQKACALHGYLSNINPFDQPGVENYKKNLFALIKKPGS